MIKRTPFAAVTAAAALTAAICTVGPRAWAQDKMMGDDHAKMSDDKMAADHMAKAKMMAADPAQAQMMASDEAKMMVMDHMAMEMAHDPKFQQMAMTAMSDPNMKKVHDDAKMMAQDPEQMKKMAAEVMADPKAMGMVMHMAGKMAMMKDDKMMGGEKMMKDDKMMGH